MNFSRVILAHTVPILIALAGLVLPGCAASVAPDLEPASSLAAQAAPGGKEDWVASRAESQWNDPEDRPASVDQAPTAAPEPAGNPPPDPGLAPPAGDNRDEDRNEGAADPPSDVGVVGADVPTLVAAKTIALDPGHGGGEIGAAFARGGIVIREKEVNLDIALRLAARLQQAGYRVVLTRDSDREANFPPIDRTGEGTISSRDDLQARVDIANDAKADLFISLHNNGSASPGESGTEIWYSKDRPFGDKNLALARELQSAILRNLLSIGYRSRDRGVKDDSNFRIFQGRPFNIFVLGPAREGFHPRATAMPGVLGETLFVSHEVEARLLSREDVLDAIAQGYFEGIEGYFAGE